jgi:hypothetical protein
MHANSMSHRTLCACCPQIHAKRLRSLCSAVQAAIAGSPLAFSPLGRGLPDPTSIKHNIQRVDRLLGNHALHAELPMLYQALIQQYLIDTPMPFIIIDWSDLATDRRSAFTEGRGHRSRIPVLAIRSNGLCRRPWPSSIRHFRY